ncbi:YqjF family protein [Georgenia yuyongxinii]
MSSNRVPRPVSLQRWTDLTFLHWALPASAVEERLPPGLELDTFDGRAWVGVTPFVMRDARPALVPAVPYLSHFTEVNVRTYVRGPGGLPGLWFYSLECPRLPVVAALRGAGVPYTWARTHTQTSGAHIAYRSRRRDGTGMHAAARIGSPTEQDPLTRFLVERYHAFVWRGRLWRVPVEHRPWPLRAATAHADVAGLFRANHLPEPRSEPLVHFSAGVDVRLGAPRRA